MDVVKPKKEQKEVMLSRRPGRPLGSKGKNTYPITSKVLEKNSRAGFLSQVKNRWKGGSRSLVLDRFKHNQLGLIKPLLKDSNVVGVDDFVKEVYVKNLMSTNEPIALLMDEWAELKTKSQLVELRDDFEGRVSKEYLEMKRLTLDIAKSLAKLKHGEKHVVHGGVLLSDEGKDEVFDVGETKREEEG